MNRRIPRLFGPLALAISLSIGVIGSATASNPGWSGSSVVPTPSTVSSGDTAGFLVTFVNGGSSNISQLFMNMSTPSGARFVEAITPPTVNCTPPSGTTPLMCSYGAVNAGQTVALTVVYTTPGTTGPLSATANWNTTGATGSDRGNNSHGDTLSKTGTVVLSTNKDFGGRFVDTTSQTTVSNDPNLGSKNKQSTSLTVNQTQLAVTVQDGFVPACISGSTICRPETFFGQASDLGVANGQVFATPFKVVLTLYHPGVAASDVQGIYHSYTDSTGVHDENITAACPPDPVLNQCFTATDVGNQNLQIVVWLLHNGKINGW